MALGFGANDHSDDKAVVMTNKTSKNLQGKESPVEISFFVCGSDNESELDHGIRGLDPSKYDDRPLNLPLKAQERPALIPITNPKKSVNSQGQKTQYFARI